MTPSSDIQPETTVHHRGRLFTVETIVREVNERRVERDVIRHPGAAVIVPVLDDGQLVLIRNRRVAVGETLLEFPAGTLEPGERPEVTAVRELEEETGYHAGSVTPLGVFYTSPGFLDETIHAFTARGLDLGERRLDPGEEIEVVVMPIDAVWGAVDAGALRDGKTIVALTLYARSGAIS